MYLKIVLFVLLSVYVCVYVCLIFSLRVRLMLSHSNRAACYTKLMSPSEALKDCEKCIELAPDFAKGYTRRGAAYMLMREYEKVLHFNLQLLHRVRCI